MKTNWNNLCFPRICGLLAARPSKLSQAMHNAGFKALGLDFFYSAFPTVNTEQSIKSCKELGFRGLSLTIPHKETAMLLVDVLSEEAKKIGSINTVINDGNNLYGFNTDSFGIEQALAEVSFDSKQALIIGAGGASRAALFTLQSLGLEKIMIYNRTTERAQKLAEEFRVEVVTDINQVIINNPCLILNSTPASDLFNLELINSKHIVFDMITDETRLIQKAREKGAKVVPGIRMLLHQGLKQFELFTEQKAPLKDMEDALIRQYQNQ